MTGKLFSSKRFPVEPTNITSTASTLIFAMVYGLIEHTLLTSPAGINVLQYPLSIHIVGQFYFYHVLMTILAFLISYNAFFDKLIFGPDKKIRIQGLLWGTGNILNFIWLEDMFYFMLSAEWPTDVMTPFHLSIYGVVWWYPLLFGMASLLYYLNARATRNMIINNEKYKDVKVEKKIS